MPTTYPLLAVRGIESTTPGFREELVQGSLGRGMNPNFIAAVLSMESGFNPKAKNPDSGALGLIQWVSDGSFAATAQKAGMNVQRSDLPRLSAEEQLPLVFAWFSDKGLTGSSSSTDYYLAVWSPALIGRPGTFVAGQKDSTARLGPGEPTLGAIYAQNSGFDRTGKGYFTVDDIGYRIGTIIESARGRAPLLVPLARDLRETQPSPGDVSSLPLPSPPRLPSFTTNERASAGMPLDLPELEHGNHGTAVRLLQMLLNQTSSIDHPLVLDGQYGEHTESAVGIHQIWYSELVERAQKIDPSGRVDERTWQSFADPVSWQKENT